MKLVNTDYNFSIEFKENCVYELILESPSMMSEAVQIIINQLGGEKGSFILSESDKELKFEKTADVILDYFGLSLNSKKILSKLYSNAEKVAESECVVEKNEINSRIVSALDKITLSLGYADVEYSFDYKWNDLFKIYDLRISESYSGLLDKMCIYLHLLSDFTEVRVLFLIHVKSYLTPEEIRELYQCACYTKIFLVLIESEEKSGNYGEIRYIIDKDLCLITP